MVTGGQQWILIPRWRNFGYDIFILSLEVLGIKPIRILHVVSSLNSASGVMHVIMNYYRHLDREKVQFDFLYFYQMPNTFEAEIKNLGGRTYYLPKPSIQRGISVYREYDRFFRERSVEYKAVHLHEVYLNLLIMPLARKYGIKHLIAHSHNTKYSDKMLNAVRNRILCFPLKNLATLYFACSEPAGRALFGKKAAKLGKVRIIKNAINVKTFKFNSEVRARIRQELKIEDHFVVGHVGRFSKQKNHDYLLKIFVEIQKIKPNSILMLIGHGPLCEDIKNKTRSMGIENSVIFLGVKRNVEEYFQAMDVFILPSLFEGLGIVAVEAQCSGLKCLVSDVVPHEARITHKFQYLSLHDNPVKWAIAACSDTKGDRNDAFNNNIKSFDIEVQAKDLEDIYLSL